MEWVLVVEDDALIACDTKSLLEGAGFAHIAIAASLTEGEAFLANEIPAIAILDVEIRGRLVFPLAAQLTRRQVPIVFVTGGHKNVIPAEWACYPVLSKPLWKDSLAAALAAARIAP